MKRGIIILIAVAALAVTSFWFFHGKTKVLIERNQCKILNDNEGKCIWDGDGVVCYIDRRNSDKLVYYSMHEGDGKVFDVTGQYPDGTRMEWHITDDSEADRLMKRSIEQKWFDGRVWVTPDSTYATMLQDQFKQIQTDYEAYQRSHQ